MHSWQIFISSTPFVYRPSEIDPAQRPDVLHELVSNMVAKVYSRKRTTITASKLLSYVAADLTVLWLDVDATITFRLPLSKTTRESDLFPPIVNTYEAGTVILIPPFLEWDCDDFSSLSTFAVDVR